MYIGSQAPNDCCIVAISNYFGYGYQTVLDSFNSVAVFDWEGITAKHRGFASQSVRQVLTNYMGHSPTFSTPRRGQEKLTGLARVGKSGSRRGHLVALIDGHVFDSSNQGIPIAKYRANYGYSLKGIWR